MVLHEILGYEAFRCRFTVNTKKLETGLWTNSAGIPYTVLLRIEAMGFPTFGLLLWGSFTVSGLGFGFRV